MFHVPRTLVSNVERGLRLAICTMVCAPRWNTTSTSYSLTTLARRSASSSRPETVVRSDPSASVQSNEPPTLSLTRPVTLAPRFCSSATTHEPNNPVAPVTNTLRFRHEKPTLLKRLPALPRRPHRPGLLEQLAITHGVHALPVVVMQVGPELPNFRQFGERALFEDTRVVVVQVVEDARLEHEEAAVDKVRLRLRLLGEPDDL